MSRIKIGDIVQAVNKSLPLISTSRLGIVLHIKQEPYFYATYKVKFLPDQIIFVYEESIIRLGEATVLERLIYDID